MVVPLYTALLTFTSAGSASVSEIFCASLSLYLTIMVSLRTTSRLNLTSFSSGRWLVTMPNAASDVFTTPVFPRMRIAGQFPYYSPVNTNQPATYQELCAQVTNAFPQKTAVINRNCDFESYPIEQTDVTPYNPFTTFSFGQQMVSSGQVGSGTISSCQENCTPGT